MNSFCIFFLFILGTNTYLNNEKEKEKRDRITFKHYQISIAIEKQLKYFFFYAQQLSKIFQKKALFSYFVNPLT